MTRRTRIDSTAGAVEIARNAGRKIEPPVEMGLTDADRSFFNSIILETPRAEWTPHRLHLAGFLAMDMARLEAAQMAVRTQGSVMAGAEGTPPRVNPWCKIVLDLTGSVCRWRRALGLTGRAGASRMLAGDRRAGRMAGR